MSLWRPEQANLCRSTRLFFQPTIADGGEESALVTHILTYNGMFKTHCLRKATHCERRLANPDASKLVTSNMGS